MQIDLTCPAEIFRTAMPTADIPAVSLTMYNLSDRIITSAEVTVRLLNGAGAEQEKMAFRGRALNGRPHSTFSMNVPMAPEPGVRSAEVRIDKVWFNDNDTWRRSDEHSVEYDPNDLPVSTALMNLKFTAGENAVGYPSQQDGLWVCVCGRPNPDSETTCARCRQEKNFVFSQYSREAVEQGITLRTRQLDLTTRSAREDTARLQRIREEEYNEKRSRRSRRIRLAVCLAACFAICAAAAFGGVPGRVSGIAAQEAAESEDPETLRAASEFLRSCGIRGDSTASADTADLRRGRILLEAGDIAGAWEAASGIAADYDGRKVLEADCLFAEGKAKMEAADWAGARDAFIRLADYEGAAELADECLLNEAKDLLEAGNYTAAREAFLSLGDYPEASTLAKECLYRTAKSQMATGDYDSAIATLSAIPDYEESRRMTFECHYMKAAAYELEGDLDSAAGEYLMAGDWGDAQEKARETVYVLAEEAFGKDDLARAQGLYGSIPGYRDADEKNYICLYALGRNMYDALEYNRAYELLSGLPEGYRNADELKVEAAYYAGRNAYEKEDWEKAAPLLAAAGNYRNAETLLIRAMEELAALRAAEEEAEREAAAENTPEETYNESDYAVEDGE